MVRTDENTSRCASRKDGKRGSLVCSMAAFFKCLFEHHSILLLCYIQPLLTLLPLRTDQTTKKGGFQNFEIAVGLLFPHRCLCVCSQYTETVSTGSIQFGERTNGFVLLFQIEAKLLTKKVKGSCCWLTGSFCSCFSI